jgi:hypothetical protein
MALPLHSIVKDGMLFQLERYHPETSQKESFSKVIYGIQPTAEEKNSLRHAVFWTAEMKRVFDSSKRAKEGGGGDEDNADAKEWEEQDDVGGAVLRCDADVNDNGEGAAGADEHVQAGAGDDTPSAAGDDWTPYKSDIEFMEDKVRCRASAVRGAAVTRGGCSSSKFASSRVCPKFGGKKIKAR